MAKESVYLVIPCDDIRFSLDEIKIRNSDFIEILELKHKNLFCVCNIPSKLMHPHFQ
jgi:hypothetical protein